MYPIKKLQNAETVSKNSKNSILTDSQGPKHPRAQDLAEIEFFEFSVTVSAFLKFLIEYIGFL